ncbi:MAG: hypothetical protein IJJ00_02570 [Erysipelotrichaceae bacterium]|nr:hypothetical protein [Erysipelotrichaceae bacterium]
MNTKLLKYLCDTPAISGHEDRLIKYVRDYCKKTADDVHVDKLGNVTATYKGTDKKAGSIAFFAHLDEIGLIVKKVEDDGYLRVERLGGVPERTLVALTVNVHTLDDKKYYPGVFGTVSHHITPADKKYQVATTSELYIDFGAHSKQEVLDMGVDVGSVVTYGNSYMELNDMVYSKSLDDRMAVYNLLEVADFLAKKRQKATVHLIFTVQEEFNIRSGTPTFNRLQPDCAICVDITPSCDTPETKGRFDVKAGRGPAVMYMNFHGRGTLGGLLCSPKLNQFMLDVAKAAKIPTQKEVIIGVITDDAFTQHVGTEGIPMSHISIPLRYTHSPVEAAAKKDIELTSKFLIEIAKKYAANKVDLSRG